MYEERFLYEQTEARPSCHVGTLVELPSGDFLGAFYAGTREGATDVALMTARMRHPLDGWEEAQVAVNTPGKPECNAVLWVDGYGHVWMFFTTLQAPRAPGQKDPDQTLGCNSALGYRIKSEDEGRSWGEPEVFSDTRGRLPKNKPIRLEAGRVVFPWYDDVTGSSFCFLSDDDGVTWRQSGRIEAPVYVIQPSLLERSDGSILALMRAALPEERPEWRRLWRSVSSDGGMTWSPSEPTDLPNDNTGADLVKLDSGNAVLLYNDAPDARTPLTVALSTDEGETWPVRRNLETEQGEFSYPSVIQDRAGRINGVYTYRRTHMKHVVFTEDWIGDSDSDPVT